MAVSLKKMQDIADRLATGESLVSICKRKGMPSYSSVTRAVTWHAFTLADTNQALAGR